MTDARPPAPTDPEMPGARTLRASWAGTALLLVTSVLAVLFEQARLVAAVVALLLFAAGSVVFFWAYAIAVGRSREVDIGIGGLFFLQGTAPKPVQRQFMASLAVEVLVAVAAAAIRPFTSLAFGILVPVWGLALAGLWGARHGTFSPRAVTPSRRRGASAPSDPPPADDAE